MKKRGEIISSKFVSIVLLLAGFIVIMLVFPSFLNEKEVNREICHDSVVLRGALPDSLNLKEVAELKCETRKVCLTNSLFKKGDCSYDFKDEPYETVRVNTNEEINRFIARELASCWAMMGKGETQVFTRGSVQKKSCVVCSRIAFDDELVQSIGGSVEGTGEYMFNHYVPEQNVSYWTYLTQSEKLDSYNKELDNFATSQKAIVFMEVEKSSFWSTILKSVSTGGWGAIGLKVGSFFGPIGAGVGGATGVIFGWISGKNAGNVIENPEKFGAGWILTDYNSESMKELECTSFENTP